MGRQWTTSDYISSHLHVSQRRACRLLKQHRSNQFYASRKDPRYDQRQRMREITNTRVRYCNRRVHVMLRREGLLLRRSRRAYRIYSEEQPRLRSKLPRRHKMIVTRRQRAQPTRAGEVWTMDFMADQLGDGAKFGILTVIYLFTRQAVVNEGGSRLRGEYVVTQPARDVARHAEDGVRRQRQ